MEPAAPSILALTQSCISKFEQLLATQKPGYIGPLESRLADFRLWADGLGALAKRRASLDFKLRDRTNDSELVKNVLIMLADSLNYSESLAGSDENSAASIRNIDSAIEILALISVAIRRTGKASRNRRADQTFDPSKHQELRKHLECVVLLRPTEEALFKKTEDGDFIARIDTSKLSDLQQRIIQANLRRRHNFLMAQKHSIAQKAPQTQPSAAQPSLPIGSLLQTESIVKTQNLDSPQNPAPVPISDLAIRIEDICPYTCIAENCPTPYLLFCTRDEWETHVKESHLPYWQCLFCEDLKNYLTMESILSHLQENHQEELLDTSLSTLLSWFAVQKKGIKFCPLCSSCGAEDSPEVVDHVLQHTYEFALRSLPWPKPVIHNLNVQPGSFNLSLDSSHTEEIQRLDAEGIQRLDAEDDKRLTAENLQRLQVVAIPQGTAEDIQQWINKEIHDRKEPPELQLTDYDRAEHAGSEEPEFHEYSNYFLTNQYFGDESDEGKSLKLQHNRSTGSSIDGSTDTDRSMWNEAALLGMQIIAAVRNEADGEEKLEILLKGQEGHVAVTEDIVKAAASNEACGKQVMRLFITQPVKYVTIEKEAVASIAESFDGEMMALLLDQRGDQISVTADFVKAAARNLESADEVIELLLAHQAKPKSTHTGDVDSPPTPPTFGGLGSLELDAVAPHHKKSGDDWYVIFNPQVQRVLDVDPVHTLLHDSVVCHVRISQDGKYVATGSNRFARIFDVYTGEEIHTLDCSTTDTTKDNYVRSVCFSPNGKYLATASEDKAVRVWDITTETLHNHFQGHEADVTTCDFAPNGRTIVSGSYDKTVRLWDIETGTNTFTLTTSDSIMAVAMSPDAQVVAAGSVNNTIYLWEVKTGSLVEHLKGPDDHRDSLFSVAFLPNGKNLVSASLDRTIKMWKLGSPGEEPYSSRCVTTFQGHSDFVLSVASSPDALWIISGSKDRSAQFWDSRTGMAQFIIQGHKNSVISVAPSPQGSYFATAGGDQKARIWAYHPYQAV
ncbi:glucose repression regulatory protein TUP1 [Trichoderma gamsii]|uniref:Glucose repression regulatory protein TUP1 n=1 Tax=Trichoderma gamsii TaxID=398673 RepID=A0A2P4ZB98_9HYPO|nr:glucose repression regulatory protein TUP1 [Trichoderma gamsii]PON21536.1 glucose repression regulatory protein TUP1 [Trichoderma gamsii]